MICRECNAESEDGLCWDCAAVIAALAHVVRERDRAVPGKLGQWLEDFKTRGPLIKIAWDWVFYAPKTGSGIPGDRRRPWIQAALVTIPARLRG